MSIEVENAPPHVKCYGLRVRIRVTIRVRVGVGVMVRPYLDVDPVLAVGLAPVGVARVVQQRGLAADVPLVRGEEQDVRATRVHLGGGWGWGWVWGCWPKFECEGVRVTFRVRVGVRVREG